MLSVYSFCLFFVFVSQNLIFCHEECSQLKTYFVLDINRPGIIPPSRLTDEKTGKDPFGIRWNEDSGKLSFVGGLQANEKGESIKLMETDENFKLKEDEIILTSTLSEGIIDYWQKVLSTVFDEEKTVVEKQLSHENQVIYSNSNNIIINKFDENPMTNGFLINSKICPNIFKEAKKLFTKEYIDKFYQKYPELLAAAISIENVLIGKKFNALYNGNHSFKLEIKKNDLINNPNLLKRMITYFEADIYKSSKLRVFNEENILKLRRKIIEKFDLQGGLDKLITQSFIRYIKKQYLDSNLNFFRSCKEDNFSKYFSITTSDINMIAFRKTWNQAFPKNRFKSSFPKFNASYNLIFIGNSKSLLYVQIMEDHMSRGKISYKDFVEKFYLSPDFELVTFNKFCSN